MARVRSCAASDAVAESALAEEDTVARNSLRTLRLYPVIGICERKELRLKEIERIKLNK